MDWLSHNSVEKLVHWENKVRDFLISHPKERSIWVKDLKVKDKSISLKYDDKGDYLWFRVENTF